MARSWIRGFDLGSASVRLRNIDPDFHELLRGSAAAFSVKGIAAASAFAMNVVIARSLGAAEAGLFFLAYTIMVVAAAVGRIGLDNTLVRFIAANHAELRWPAIHGLYRAGLVWATLASIVTATVLWGVSEYLAYFVFNKPAFAGVMEIMAWAVVPMALLVLHAQALQGLKRIAQSVFLLSAGFPIVLSLLMLSVPPNGADAAAWLVLSSALMVAILGRRWWVRGRPTPVQCQPVDRREVLASCLPLLTVVILSQTVAWSSQIYLGIWGTSSDVAVFSVVLRIAMLMTFVLIAVNSIAGPKFAEMHHRGEIHALRSTAARATGVMTALAVPPLAAMLVFPNVVLGVFGPDFRSGATSLMIMAVAQFINVATGSVGHILMMTGNEKLLRNNTLVAAITAVLLGYLLVPRFELVGAALATGVSIALQNLLSLWQVSRLFGIEQPASRESRGLRLEAFPLTNRKTAKGVNTGAGGDGRA